ncbi:MAG: glycosyltransferase [Bdellovibrionales bacterium]|nr:glycosyltransferase [Bdellovibrionales bacterium]
MNHWPLTILHSLAALTKIIIPLIFVRVFPQEIIGEYKLFFLFVYLAPELFAVGGVINGLGYWSGEKEKRGLITAASITVLVMTFLAIPVVLLGYFLGWFPFSSKGLLFAFILYIAVSLPRAYLEELLIVVGEVWVSAGYRFISELLRAATLISVALATGDLATALIASAVVSAVEIVLYLRKGIKRELWCFAETTTSHLRRVLRYALPLSIAGVATVLFEKCDQFFLSQSLSAQEFALYSLGCLMIPPLLILEQSVTRVLVPALSSARNLEDSREKQVSLYRSGIAQLLFWMVPSALFLIVCAEPVVTVLYTELYADSAPYLRVYALLYILLALPLDVLPRAHGKSLWLTRTYLISGALSVLFVALFGSLFGPLGALSGLLLVQAGMRGYGLYYAASVLKISPALLLPVTAVFRIGAASVVAAVVAELFLSSASLSPLTSLLVVIPLFGASFLLTWVLFPARARVCLGEKHAVVQVTQYLSMGGLERMVTGLAAALEDGGRWESHVFVYDTLNQETSGGLQEYLEGKGVRVKSVTKRSGFCVRTLLSLSEYVRNNHIEVLHSHDLGGLLYAALTKLISIESPLLIHTQHSFVHLSRHKRYRYYERFFTFLADKVVAVSREVEDTYRSIGVPKRKLVTIENGVKFELAAPLDEVATRYLRGLLIESLGLDGDAAQLVQSKSWIVYLGRIFPGKGQAKALEVWNALPETLRKDSALLFVGPRTSEDEFRKLLEFRSACEDADRIYFIGETQCPELWYQAASVSLSCSDFEGHPLVPIEAMGNGSLFVASDIVGHRSLVQSATLYEAGKAESAASALSGVLTGQIRFPKKWMTRREVLLKSFQHRYSFLATLAQYEQLYRQEMGVGKPLLFHAPNQQEALA